MKNYVKETQKLPLYGIGPYLAIGIALLHLLVVILTSYVFKAGILSGIWIPVFRTAGVVLMIIGASVWFTGALRSGMDDNIADNRLKTDGIYAWVRNPMYTGIWFVITGVSLMWHNYWILPVILVDWMILTIVLKNTEEKWLLELYGAEYAEYKKSVNRCIPWIPKRK